jgi:polyisoprenoid-binding protein YceI
MRASQQLHCTSSSSLLSTPSLTIVGIERKETLQIFWIREGMVETATEAKIGFLNINTNNMILMYPYYDYDIMSNN